MFDAMKEWFAETFDLFRSDDTAKEITDQRKLERSEKRTAFWHKVKSFVDEDVAIVGISCLVVMLVSLVCCFVSCYNAQQKDTEEQINSALASSDEDKQQTDPSTPSISYESWSDLVSSTLLSCSTDEVVIDESGVLQISVSDISNAENFIVSSEMVAMYTGALPADVTELPHVEGCTIRIYENNKIVGMLVFAPSFSNPPIFSSTIFVSPECGQSDELWDCYFEYMGTNDLGYSIH